MYSWAFGLQCVSFDIPVLGCTWGTKVWYPKGHAHVSSPQVLGGVEDSSKDFEASCSFFCRKYGVEEYRENMS
jgi:hypothetical protein